MSEDQQLDLSFEIALSRIFSHRSSSSVTRWIAFSIVSSRSRWLIANDHRTTGTLNIYRLP
jgi:hypothetical protein